MKPILLSRAAETAARAALLFLFFSLFLLVSACGASKSVASWYGPGFAGKQTASGEVFDPTAMTAAHESLPFGTRVRVTNTANGEAVVVRINDRFPGTKGRAIDLSEAAFEQIAPTNQGLAQVRIDVID